MPQTPLCISLYKPAHTDGEKVVLQFHVKQSLLLHYYLLSIVLFSNNCKPSFALPCAVHIRTCPEVIQEKLAKMLTSLYYSPWSFSTEGCRTGPGVVLSCLHSSVNLVRLSLHIRFDLMLIGTGVSLSQINLNFNWV